MKHLEKENVSILTSALEERYKSIHTIRERVQSVGIWAIGIMSGAGGWLLQSDIDLSFFQKSIYVMGVIVAYRILRFHYLADLNKGFKSQQKVAARIEKTLGLFTPGVFDNEEIAIYPKGWENAGKEEGEGNFFLTTHTLLFLGVIFLIIAIIFSGCS